MSIKRKRRKNLSIGDAKKYYAELIDKYRNHQLNSDDRLNTDIDKLYATFLKEYIDLSIKEVKGNESTTSINMIQPIEIKYHK